MKILTMETKAQNAAGSDSSILADSNNLTLDDISKQRSSCTWQKLVVELIWSLTLDALWILHSESFDQGQCRAFSPERGTCHKLRWLENSTATWFTPEEYRQAVSSLHFIFVFVINIVVPWPMNNIFFFFFCHLAQNGNTEETCFVFRARRNWGAQENRYQLRGVNIQHCYKPGLTHFPLLHSIFS